MASSLQMLGILSEDDELVLLSTLIGKSSERTSLQLDKLSDQDFNAYFRFKKNDIHRLRLNLRLPEKISCSNRTAVSGIEALCILLRRFAYPSRLIDLAPIFNRSNDELWYINYANICITSYFLL